MTRVAIGGKGRLLAANHVLSLSPADQRVYHGQVFTLAGIDDNLPKDGDSTKAAYFANGFFNVSIDDLTTLGTATKNNPLKFKTANALGPNYPAGVTLYGLNGSDEDGNIFDPVSQQWYKDVVAVAGATGVAGTVGLSSYVLGGNTVQTGAALTAPKRAYELTMLRDGRFFYALNARDSAAQDSPHTGVVAAGPALWPPQFGKPSDNGLPDGLYLLSVDPADAGPADAAIDSDGDGVPDIIIPAAKAYKALILAAQRGDAGALEAANALSIDIPNAGGLGGAFQGIESFFQGL